MAEVDFIGANHRATKRDYLARVNGMPKAEAAKLAKQWGYNYWDGQRDTGYGGYHDDGRWRPVADRLIAHYGLTAGDCVLDVGCGKGFLVNELRRQGIDAFGLDVSTYALEHAPEAIQPYLRKGCASRIAMADKTFDLVISINVLHNLPCRLLESALCEMERVGKAGYLCVESYRSEEEKVNLLYWQLTCLGFYSPDDWRWWFGKCGYTGDYSFIYFE